MTWLYRAASLLIAFLACNDPTPTSSGTPNTAPSPSGDLNDTGASSGGRPDNDRGVGGGPSSTSGGGFDTGGTAYVPEPIPEIDPEPPAPCPQQTPTGYFQFLDDTCSDKVLPTDTDRDRACPTADLTRDVMLDDGSIVTYAPSGDPVTVDTQTLPALVSAGVLPSALTMTVILVRRVGGAPHYRYLSTGDHDTAYQPWSTTKFLAAANAAAYLRIVSDYKVGLTGSVDGLPLGDLVTSVHNYDGSPYSSNGLGRYFHNVGGRDRANALIHVLWLDRDPDESFGGNYGAAAPPLGYAFSDGSASVAVDPDTTAGPANHLSSFTMAEALKRLVLHREEPTQRLPGIQWKDIRVLLFGAENSAQYGPWGGMTADTAVYLQTGHSIDYIDERSHGQWRIFSKLGLGSGGQFLNVGYACLPVLNPALEPVTGWGREFLISAQLPSGSGTWAERDRELARAYRAVIARIVDGRI